jgi:transposase
VFTKDMQMNQKSSNPPSPSERLVKDIRRATRKHYSAEDKIRIVLDGLRGEASIAELCRREGIAESRYGSWSKDFLEAGKRRLAGDAARAATTDEVKGLRREARMLKEVVAEQTLELRLLKRMARPVRKQFLRSDLASLRQRIRRGRPALRQDGDPRVPVLIKAAASGRHFLAQGSETPVDCQAISLPPPADLNQPRALG